MYSIERYVIKFVSDLQQVMVSSTNETDRQNITEGSYKSNSHTIMMSLI
jgi:tRNA G37 N-methylase Trm5